MTTIRILLCVIVLLALASVGFAQQPNVKVLEPTVTTVRMPDGRLQLVAVDDPELKAERAARLKTTLAKLSAEYKDKTFWFRPAYVPLKIVDVVVVGDQIKFVIQKTTGESFTDNRLPSDVYFTRDPRQIFSARAWAYIERSKVFVGMTKDQALASWGRPERINRTLTRGGVSEQWVYGLSTYLYFTNGKLTAAQN